MAIFLPVPHLLSSYYTSFCAVARHAGHGVLFESIMARNWASTVTTQFTKSIAWVQKQKKKKLTAAASSSGSSSNSGSSSSAGLSSSSGGSAKKKGR